MTQRCAYLFRSAASCAVLFWLASCSQWLAAQGRTDTIAQTGDAAPDGNGTYSSFGNPVLNDAGQAAFFAWLTGTSGGLSDDTGIFRGSGGTITQIAREGQAAPDGNGTHSAFLNLVLNDSGQAAFKGFLTGTGGGENEGIFRGSGGSITQIARVGQAAPDGNGTFLSFNNPDLNDVGAAAFRATLTGTSGGFSDNSGIFRGSGGTITQIARAGQAAPDGNGTYSNFSTFLNPVLNDAGQAAFFASLNGTSGGLSDDTGIFRGSGGTITQIAREGQAAPDGNGSYSAFLNLVLNDAGQAAFRATLTGTSGGEFAGIFRGSGGAITQIARLEQAAPDGNGTYSGFGNPVLNNSGQAAFSASLTGTTGGTSDDHGIFRGSGGSITQIAREGQAAPDGNGTLSIFDNPGLNDAGAAAFRATLTGTSGGASDASGIFIGDGIDLLQVARKGESAAGSTITGLIFRRDGLNEHGQVAYRAILNNGNEVVQRWTPDLHWRMNFSSSWDTSSRWTLGLTPGQPHDVFIDPDASLTVFGPSNDTTVRSLEIGGGTGLATLDLRNGATLSATNGVTIQSTGTLTGDGTIAGDITNNGTIIAENITVASTLTNNRTIEGNGRVHANIANNASGRIRALGGNNLWLSGPSLSNAGLIEVHDNSELTVDATLNNQSSTGLVSIRNRGSLIANGGITNSGSMAMTIGSSSIQGDTNNTGTIQVSGGAHATFFDDLTQNGVMQVSSVGNTNSTAVVLGAFTGSGGFTGGGDLFALGDLRPGNSPASVLMDGNLFLGAATDTFVELGGLNPGEFDQLLVTGDFNLAGDLLVSLINGHTLGFNQEYLIADVGGLLNGQFNGLGEGDLVGNFDGMDLFITYGAGDGNDIGLFTAVPEPGTCGVMLLAGLIGVGFTRRRRSQPISCVNSSDRNGKSV